MIRRSPRSTTKTPYAGSGVGEENKENVSTMNDDGKELLETVMEERETPTATGFEENPDSAHMPPAAMRRGRGRPKKNASQPPALVTLDAPSSVEPEASQPPVRRSTRARSEMIDEIPDATVPLADQERLATPASPAPAAPAPTMPELSLAEEEEMLLDLEKEDPETQNNRNERNELALIVQDVRKQVEERVKSGTHALSRVAIRSLLYEAFIEQRKVFQGQVEQTRYKDTVRAWTALVEDIMGETQISQTPTLHSESRGQETEQTSAVATSSRAASSSYVPMPAVSNTSLPTPPTPGPATSMTTPRQQGRRVLEPVGRIGGLGSSKHAKTLHNIIATQFPSTAEISPYAASRMASAKRLHVRDDDDGVAPVDHRSDGRASPPKRVRYTEADVSLPGLSTSTHTGSERLPTPPIGMQWAPKDRAIRESVDTDMESGGRSTTGRLTAERATASVEPSKEVIIKREPSPDVPTYSPEASRDSARGTLSIPPSHNIPTILPRPVPQPNDPPRPVPEPSRVPEMHRVDLFHLCIPKQLSRAINNDELAALNNLQAKVNEILSGRRGRADIPSQMPKFLREGLSASERRRIVEVQNRIKAANEYKSNPGRQGGRGKGKGPVAPPPAPAPVPTRVIAPPVVQTQPGRPPLTLALGNLNVGSTPGPWLAMSFMEEANRTLRQAGASFQLGFGAQDTIDLHELRLL